MARKVFYSFHFKNDFWRTQQVRNIGSLEGQTLCTPNAWEEVKQKGDSAIEAWIDKNLTGKSCLVVLIGAQTSLRPWVLKEIVKGWDAGKGVLGVRIHQLLGHDGEPSTLGNNPFDRIKLGTTGKKLSSVAPLVNPVGVGSKAVYASISRGIESWIENAISVRDKQS